MGNDPVRHEPNTRKRMSPNALSRNTVAVAAILLLSFACANLEVPDEQDGSTRPDTLRPDVTELDDEPDAVDVPDTLDINDEPDAFPPPGCPNEVAECDPDVTAATCNDEGTATIRCNSSCGFITETTCDSGEFCFVNDGVGECTPPPNDECDPTASPRTTCVPGETDQRHYCENDGTYGEPETCETGRRCLDGRCVNNSGGNDTGAACSTNQNCQDACICADNSDYTPDSGVPNECNVVPWNNGFCTVDGCTTDGCTEDDVCALTSQTRYNARRDICLPTAPCVGLAEGDFCTIGSSITYVCREVQVHDAEREFNRWELACFREGPLRSGLSCTTSSECMSSRCIIYSPNPSISMCTNYCAEDAECPTGATCVEYPDSWDGNSETPLAESGVCAFGPGDCDSSSSRNPSLVVRGARALETGATVNVCYLPAFP